MRQFVFGRITYSLIALAVAAAFVGCPPAPTAPQITTQPASATVNVGDPVSLSVAATGTAPLSYQWQKGGAAVANATAATLSFAAAQTSDAGSYSCVVSNSAGSATSTAAAITVNVPPTPPAITTQPTSVTVTVGAGVTLSVAASGTAPLGYQWQKDGANVSGATGAALAIASAQLTDAGSYVCVVSNAAGSATSNAAMVTVNPPPTPPAITTQPASLTVAPNMPASLSVVASGTAPLSYQWIQNETPVSGATKATYSVAVAAAANDGSYACTVSNSAGSVTSEPATLIVFGIQVLAKNAQDITAEGLTTQPSSGLRNVAIGTDVYLAATPAVPDAVYSWSIATQPSGSSPSLSATTGSNIVFNPDKEGTYVIQVAQGAAKDDTVGASVEITVGTWVGAGIVAKDGSSIRDSECVDCHVSGGPAPDKITPWLKTGHATMFARGIDGEVSSHYGPSCRQCHTVGFNTAASAVNSGTDDLATLLGWTWPATLQAGNWDSLAANYPTLAKLGNIQCENCHGPASQHPENAFSGDLKMDKSLDAGVCGQCHYGNHPQLNQWELSGHADATSQAFSHPAGNTACARCHTGGGYIDFVDGVPEAQRDTKFQIITCAVCHDPHDDTNEHQLRAASVQLPSDAAPRTDEGTSATCMNCHNARVTSDTLLTAASPSFPHHSTASEILKGVGGITFGAHLTNSPHQYITKCTDCHMAASPASGQPGANKVGGHTFQMRFVQDGDPDNGFQNFQNACNSAECHNGTVTDLNRSVHGDFDGQNGVQGIQDEVKGLLALVKQAIVSQTGVVALDAYPSWKFDNVPGDKMALARQAVWNYTLVDSDGSYGVHNTAYAVGLLQLTYHQLTGTEVPGAVLRY